MSDFERDVIAMVYFLKRKIPAMYLGSHSITALWQFINGFGCGYSFPKIHNFRIGFQEYIENKYIGHQSSMGWHMILLENVSNDEKQALDLFFEEFEMFLKESNIEMPNELPIIEPAEWK